MLAGMNIVENEIVLVQVVPDIAGCARNSGLDTDFEEA